MWPGLQSPAVEKAVVIAMADEDAVCVVKIDISLLEHYAEEASRWQEATLFHTTDD